jgi:chromodomain-helicase-DNA-binding protein 4
MLEDETLPQEEKQKKLIGTSGKLVFLKQLLPRLKERGHRVLLFSQVSWHDSFFHKESKSSWI